jgi:hypothetical protein
MLDKGDNFFWTKEKLFLGRCPRKAVLLLALHMVVADDKYDPGEE